MYKKIYIHNKTGKEYLLISTKHRFKLDGVWHDAYLYQPRYENEYEYFSKVKEEFKNEFTKAKYENHQWVPDN